MKNEHENDNLENLLKAELKKEAEKIMAEIEADESLKNVTLPEDLDAGVMEAIQKYKEQKEAEEKLSPETKALLQRAREREILGIDEDDETIKVSADAAHTSEETGAKTVRFRKKKRKVYALVAAVAVMVLAIGMTSIGGTPLISQISKYVIGDRQLTQIDTNREDGTEVAQAENDEAKAYQEIKDQMGIEAARLGYMPEGTEFLECKVNESMQKACLLYRYDNKIIEYKLLANYTERSSAFDLEDTFLSEFSIKVNGNTVTIKHYEVEESGEDKYAVCFAYKNTTYMLTAMISENEMEEIAKNLIFL